jgi:hypothetical protein
MAPATWEATLPPWLLVKVPTGDGRSVALCDFANAGVTGRPYRSWLPVVGGKPRRFCREQATWV